MTEITRWKKTRHFFQGIKILRKYMPYHEALPRLASGPNAMNRDLLLQAINSISMEVSRAHQVVLPQEYLQEEPTGEVLVKQVSTPARDGLYPPVINQAIQDRSRLANQRDALANKLRDEPNKEIRASMYASMQKFHAQIQPLTDIIEKYKTTGEVTHREPEKQKKSKRKKKGWKPELSSEEKKRIDQDIRNMRSRISVAKRSLKEFSGKEPGDPIVDAKVDYYKTLSRRLEEELEKLYQSAYVYA